jgi:hypothetical protein
LVGGIGWLKALTISRKLKRGYYADGGGLYLQVGRSGGKSWVFRFRRRSDGRLREMGLGSFQTVSLVEARDAATVCRKQLRDGADPIEARHKGRLAQAADEASRMVTFKDCSEGFIENIPVQLEPGIRRCRSVIEAGHGKAKYPGGQP